MNKLNNYFTTNQTLALQNFTWEEGEIPCNSLYIKEINQIIDT